jgi:hypothetical protein
MFRHGIAAAPTNLPLHSVVLIRFSDGRVQRVVVADRERHSHLKGKPHFDVARRGNCSENASYRIVHIGDGKYQKRGGNAD